MPPAVIVGIRQGSYLCPVPSLSTRDYEAALAVVAAASHGSLEEPLPRQALEALHGLIPIADVVAYWEGRPGDRVNGRTWVSGWHPAWTDEDRRLIDRLRYQIPTWPSPATIGHARRLTDLMSLRAYRHTDLYNLVGRPHRVEYTLDCWLRSPDGIVRGFSLDSSRRDFSERDRDLLDVLGRHLATVLGRRDPRLPRPAAELGLTRREAEILAWVARGRTNQEIAALLSVSSNTVRKHLENAYLRLGVHSRAAAIAVAYESNLHQTSRRYG